MIWVAHRPGTPITAELPPRFLGYGLYNRAGRITPWRGEAPPEAVAGSQFWSAHLISVNNLPTETRDRYYNCLITPPTIVESLPSLTSAITDFSSVTIALADPSIRSFFSVDLSEVSVQNNINIYRIICDNRYLIWRGYLDGVSIDAAQSTTIQARPITKRLDRQATFGFDNEIPNWRENNFRIPIVAARLIPYTVQAQDHSEVGCAPFSDSYYDDITNLRFRSIYDRSALVHSYAISSSRTSGLCTDYDYGRLALDAAASNAWRGLMSTGSLNVNPDDVQEINTGLDRIRANYEAHLEHRRPQYVSFDPGQLVPTRIQLSRSGKISFDRGVFFVASDDADVSSRFDPSSANYVLSDLPETYVTPSKVGNEVSAAHLDKFLLGSEWFELDSNSTIDSSNLFPGGVKIYPLISKASMFAEAVNAPYIPRYRAGYSGFDQTSIFPSLKLGDSYANWTVIPVESGGQVVHDHPSELRLTRPRISERIHPLDSFYRWTLASDKSGSASVGAYLRACIYTPHAIGLTYYPSGRNPYIGRNAVADLEEVASKALRWSNRLSDDYIIHSTLWLQVFSGSANNLFFTDNKYAFVRWTTFMTLKGGSIGKSRHISEVPQYLRLLHHRSDNVRIGPGIYSSDGDTDDNHLRLGVYLGGSGARNTWLDNGMQTIAMARSKDMYGTTSQIDRHIRIDAGRLASIKGGDHEVDTIHQSGAQSNLRVMPALPASSILDHDYPMIQTTRSPYGGGAYYISSSYGLLDEVGYWDSSVLNNPTAASGLEEDRYFRGYYHHDQTGAGQGVAPATFIRAIIQSAGFRTDLGFSSGTYTELTSKNPMQLISDSDGTYRELLGRALPALGKFCRFNPYANQIELIDWSRTAPLFPFDNAAARAPIASFDEGCMIYRGLNHTAASRVTSFVYENPDMIRGTNTLDNFSDSDFRLSKYASFHSTAFAQGRTIRVPTGTWWENADDGIHFYDRLASTLSQRIDVINFFVPMEVLLGLGAPDFVSVGKWVRIVNSALVGGIADVLIMETAGSESGVEFRAYRFADTMSAYAGSSAKRNPTIKDPIDNKIPLPSPPTEDTLPDPSDIVVTDYDSTGTTTNIGGFIVPRDRDDNPELPVMTVRNVGEPIIVAGMEVVFRSMRGIAIESSESFRGIYVHPDNDLIYACTTSDEIFVYNLEGTKQTSIELSSSVFGPRGIAVTDTRIYISAYFYSGFQDIYDRIFVYDFAGDHVEDETFDLNTDNASPEGMTIYNNELYTVDTTTDKIFVYDLSGTLQRSISIGADLEPKGIDIADDYIYIVADADNTVISYTLAGVKQSKFIRLRAGNASPEGLSVVGDRLYVLDRNDTYIYTYDRLGYSSQLLQFGGDIRRSWTTDAFEIVRVHNSLIKGVGITDDYIYLYDHYDRPDETDVDESIPGRIIYAFTHEGVAQPAQNISFSLNYTPFRRDSIYSPVRDMAIQGSYIYFLTFARGGTIGINRYNLSGVFQDRIAFTDSDRGKYIRMSVTSDRIYILLDDELTTNIRAYDHSLNRQASEDMTLDLNRSYLDPDVNTMFVLDIDIHPDKIYAVVDRNRSLNTPDEGNTNGSDVSIFMFDLDGRHIGEHYIGDRIFVNSFLVQNDKAYISTGYDCFVYDISRSNA